MTERSTASPDQADILRGLVSKSRVPVGSPIYNQILEALYDEAAALDERRFHDWTPMLGPELIYTAPIRLTRLGKDRDRDVMRSMYHFDDNHASIMARVERLSKSAFAEDPPSRCRRLVTNVRVGETAKPDEFEVVSYLFLERSRGDNPDNERMSAERRDVWRREGHSFKLARREIIVDQAVLGMANFAVFL